MGFRKPDITPARHAIARLLVEIHSPHNDGFIQMTCKKDLYQLKCYLDQQYSRLPTFAGEEQWEQERIIQILKDE